MFYPSKKSPIVLSLINYYEYPNESLFFLSQINNSKTSFYQNEKTCRDTCVYFTFQKFTNTHSDHKMQTFIQRFILENEPALSTPTRTAHFSKTGIGEIIRPKRSTLTAPIYGKTPSFDSRFSTKTKMDSCSRITENTPYFLD